MQIKSCQRCSLSETCNNILEPRGRYKHPVFFIGEASGKEEDEIGIPFIGASGKMLERILSSVSFSSEDFYITNLCRCRPPENRTPTKPEIYACYRYLYREIVSNKPKYIILLGNTPLKLFLGSDKSIGKCVGQEYTAPLVSPKYIGKRGKKAYTQEHYCFLAWYHPSALLRNNSLEVNSPKWITWQCAIDLSSKLKT